MDLVVLDMVDYEVILGMDWLSEYHASIDCVKESVTFQPTMEQELLFISTIKKLKTVVISAKKAKRLFDISYIGYLASMVDTSLEQHTKEEIFQQFKNFLKYF